MSKYRMTIRKSLTAIIAFMLAMSVAHAHHSFNANFDRSDKRELTGVVTEFWFANPHARIYIDVTNDDGEVEEWMVEGNSRNNLIRKGWSADTLTPGMTITVTGFASRDGSNTLGWIPNSPLYDESGQVVGPQDKE